VSPTDSDFRGDIVFRARSTLAALGVASLALVGACATPGSGAQAETRPAWSGSAPAPELATFYDQQITFGPCLPYAQTDIDKKAFADPRYDCARVQVPVDYADPEGPRGEIALLRIKARGEKIGSLLIDPGGPGSSGMNFAALFGNEKLGQPLTKGTVGDRFDVIGFDPRGVGASTPKADCYTDAEYDHGMGFVANPLPNVTSEQQAREVAQRCEEASGGRQTLVNFGTSTVARDMDVMRGALGDEKLSYLGYSYGTELGAMYAEAFPQNVRAIALDGAVDPELTAGQFRKSQYVGFQNAFTKMATACAAQADCPLGTDPARANEKFQDILRPLLTKPATTKDPRGLTYDNALAGVVAKLYSDGEWPVIIKGLTELAAGRGDTLLQSRDQFLFRDTAGHYGVDPDSNVVIRCMDNPRRTAAEQAELAKEIFAVAPFLDSGRPAAQLRSECEAWPAQPSRPEPWITGNVDVPPTLTISVTGDPATPHQGGINLARALKGSLLTVDAARHGISLLGVSECVDRVVSDYLIDLKTPPADARCTV
jgi:pimeloyl-ACP methyl ester carboxylesterase